MGEFELGLYGVVKCILMLCSAHISVITSLSNLESESVVILCGVPITENIFI